MIQNHTLIDNIPAILWGENSSKVFIAVHGDKSSKSDTPIVILAEEATSLGYQVLSFDLPEHGDRKNDATLCKVQNCVAELNKIMEFSKSRFETIGLIANSIGAYFSLLAFKDETLQQCLFLSPLVDMNRMIDNMMKWFDITEERLQTKQEIATPIGQTLYWDYYQYVKQNPITKWEHPTSILYGEKDTVCEFETVASFAKQFVCNLETSPFSEHYFHTDQDLKVYRNWLRKHIEY